MNVPEMNVRNEKGQTMVLISIIIGGIFLSSSVIAGLLMFFQLRQANDAVTSGMAFFAADAGVEQALDCYYHQTTSFPADTSDVCPKSGTLSNGATYDAYLWCADVNGARVSCLQNDPQNDPVYGFWVQSTGDAPGTERILKTYYAVRFN